MNICETALSPQPIDSRWVGFAGDGDGRLLFCQFAALVGSLRGSATACFAFANVAPEGESERFGSARGRFFYKLQFQAGIYLHPNVRVGTGGDVLAAVPF